MSLQKLPIPQFFNPSNASQWNYAPDQSQLFSLSTSWRKSHHLTASGSDKKKASLLLIDLQKDFCLPNGSLYVAGRSGNGAIEDNVRIAKFIYENLGIISNIVTTMDTHFAFQIFFASFWVDSEGNPLNSHTMIVPSDDGKSLNNINPSDNSIISEGVMPNPAIVSWLCSGNYGWACNQARFYSNELMKGGQYALYLWPPHCILGSDGHPLVGVIHEARMFHSYVRGSQSGVEVKGGNAWSENYSVFQPEVLKRFDDHGALAQKNVLFLKTMIESDVVIIAGQAKSHCVAWTISHLLSEILEQDKSLASKVYLLGDCTSSVVVPGGPDFTDAGDKAFEKFIDAGMNLVNSCDPISSWNGISL